MFSQAQLFNIKLNIKNCGDMSRKMSVMYLDGGGVVSGGYVVKRPTKIRR